MTEQSNAALIAEAKTLGDPNFSLSVPEKAKRVIQRLVSALEAAERRLKAMRELATLYGKEWDAERERSAGLAAVVEKVRAVNLHEEDEWDAVDRILPEIREALASAPADALREVRAAAWDEGYSHCFDFEDEDGGVSLLDNPYLGKEQS